MDEGIDTGPILGQRKTLIGPDETAKDLHDRLAGLGAQLLIDTISDWINGRTQLNTQNNDEATYSKILTRQDGRIDLKKDPLDLYRRIRAFDPWPGTYILSEKNIIRVKEKENLKQKIEVRLKILKARMEKDKLIIEKVQPEGKKPMEYKDFLLGHDNHTRGN